MIGEIQSLQERLLSWFRRHGRALPWRQKRSSYRTWISEMMLQQTQVKTVVPYFKRWMNELPSIRALNRASERKVLTLWQGLGYYNRARNIKKAASFIRRKYQGKIPQDYEEILKIPGIGPYSAAAILSLAYNKKVPLVDGNISRVISRLFAVRDPVGRTRTQKRIRDLEASILPDDEPGVFNEALMELGALVCLPRNPQCTRCPLTSHCVAYHKGLTDELPKRMKRPAIEKIGACALVPEKEGRFFVHKRPVGELMGGLWEFPEWKTKGKSGHTAEDQKRLLGRLSGAKKSEILYVTTIRRHYTHFAETLSVYKTCIRDSKPLHKDSWPHRWLRASQLKRYPLTSAHSRIRDILCAGDA